MMLSNNVFCLQLIPHGGCRNQDESDDDDEVLEVSTQHMRLPPASLEEKTPDRDTEEKEEAKEEDEKKQEEAKEEAEDEKKQEAKHNEEKPTITKGTAGPLLLPKMGHLAACLSKMFLLLCFHYFTMFSFYYVFHYFDYVFIPRC